MADDDNVTPPGDDQAKTPKEQANAMWGEINKEKNIENQPVAAAPVNPFADDNYDEDAVSEGESTLEPESESTPVSEPKLESAPESEPVPKDSSEYATPRNPFADDDYSEEEVADSAPAPAPLPEADEKDDVIEAEVVNDSTANLDDLEDAEKSEFWEILEQAGITRKNIFTGLIVLGVLVMFIFSFFFAWWDIFSFGDGGNEDDKTVVQEEADLNDEVQVDAQSDDFYSVISSYIVGLEFRPLDKVQPIGQWGTFVPIETAFEIGLDIRKLRASSFVEYVDLLRKLENAFNTDVYALLDLAVEDRRDALEKHIGELNQLIVEGQNAIDALENELTSFNDRYVILLEERDRLEANYFTQLDLMQGEAAYQNLLLFTDISQQTVALRAEFNGRSSVQEMLNNVVSFLIPRLRDIQANTEALVKGIRVFDIPGSNIDTIVPVEVP